MTKEAEIGERTSKIAGNNQKLEEARKDPPLQVSEELRPCRHLDFGLLASRSVKQYISVVFSH